jgi:S1-C subfamily serine protease
MASSQQVGIGIVLHQRPDGLIVKMVQPGSPAAAAGVQEGTNATHFPMMAS